MRLLGTSMYENVTLFYSMLSFTQTAPSLMSCLGSGGYWSTSVHLVPLCFAILRQVSHP